MGPAVESPPVVHFGKFEADLRTGELRRDGIKIHLQDLPFRTLALLLEHANEVVTHEELRRALWPDDVFVDFDRAIRSAVKRLRDALGDSADNPIFIETVERRGYRWIGPIRYSEPASPRDVVHPESAAAKSFDLRLLIFAIPILTLLSVAWILFAVDHSGTVGTRSRTTSHTGVRNPANPEAEDFYLKGRYYWNKRTPESLNQAVDAFTQAIIRDPKYAAAYMGLADCYNLLREYSAMPSQEAYSRAYAAAKRAVELDDESSEAHASLAFVTFFGMWNPAVAEQEFRRAIALDANNAKAHHWYATFLQAMGRHEESLSEIERARELDPNSPSILADKGVLLWDAGKHGEGLQLLKQLETTEPSFVSPHRYLRFVYFESRDYANYLGEMKVEANLTHFAPDIEIAEAASRGFVRSGERGLLEEQLQAQDKFCQAGQLSPYWAAQTANRLGYTGEALRDLEISFQKHDDSFLLASQDATFANLHQDAGFRRLVDKVGMSPATQ